jgi:predicted Fe-Mo cluster-binding NifX family protein
VRRCAGARATQYTAGAGGGLMWKELAAKSGFELVNVGPDKMDAFMKERIKVYTAVGRQMGLTGGK